MLNQWCTEKRSSKCQRAEPNYDLFPYNEDQDHALMKLYCNHQEVLGVSGTVSSQNGQWLWVWERHNESSSSQIPFFLHEGHHLIHPGGKRELVQRYSEWCPLDGFVIKLLLIRADGQPEKLYIWWLHISGEAFCGLLLLGASDICLGWWSGPVNQKQGLAHSTDCTEKGQSKPRQLHN